MQGYEALKAGVSKDTVKQLSRLQRFCGRAGMSDYLKEIYRFRVDWVLWINVERHFLETIEYVSLHAKARELMRSGFTLDAMAKESKEIAKQFAHLSFSRPLTAEHVLGLVFTLASESAQFDKTA